MANQSIQRAKFLKRENTTTKNGMAGTKITYIHLRDDGTTKENTTQWLNQYLPEDSKKIYEKLKEGDEFVVVKREDGKFWPFQELRDVSTYKPKPVWDGNSSNYKGGNKNHSGGKSNYDNLGQQIGNSITNAVNSLGAGKTVEEYKQRALELVLAGDWVREQIENKGKQQDSELRVQSYNQDMDVDDSSVPF